jgi:hypothetical protein
MLVMVAGLAVSLRGVSGAQQAAAAGAKSAATAGKTTGAAGKSGKANDHVRRLEPSELAGAVPGLPAEFVEKLNARGCTIPQFDAGGVAGAGADGVANGAASGASDASDAAGSAAQPNNAIRGEFARRGQKDWAALCSNGTTSTIVIFWGKATACPASLARLDDAHYLKAGGGKRDRTLHYSRAIRALGEDGLDARPGLGELRPLKHQGIDDRFVGKSSAFFYCNEGKWRIFPAKDAAGGAAK